MSPVSLAISPCPNDTLMFHDLLTSQEFGIQFNLEFADIEELNKGLQNSKWDMAKMSVAAYPLFMHDYEMLTTGMAMGFGNGPLLISSVENLDIDTYNGEILIPGENTTANALIKKYFPHLKNKREMLFSDIPKAVTGGEAGLGLIIHESRFTYMDLGLHKVADLGEIWEKDMHLPLPLGAIVVKRSLPNELKKNLAFLLKKSIEKGLERPSDAMDFILENSSEKDIEVVKSHIDLYVNDFSIDAGEKGQNAVLHLLSSDTENDSLTLQQIFFTWEK